MNEIENLCEEYIAQQVTGVEFRNALIKALYTVDYPDLKDIAQAVLMRRDFRAKFMRRP